jgi:DNA-binding CsgD family transcriptional regulator
MNGFGAVIPYSRAVQASDPRLRVMAQIVAYVASTFEAPHAICTTVQRDARIGTVVAWRVNGDDASARKLYLKSYAEGDALAPGRFAATTHTVVSIDEVGGAERFRDTPYGAFLAGSGIDLVGAMYLRRHGRIVACVGLLRELGSPPLTTAELAAARRLHPLLETAYACSLETSPGTTAEDWFDEADLTARQRDVVRIAALGVRNIEIASALSLSVGTVKAHLHQAFGKLGVQSRAELAARLRANDGVGS